MKTVAVVVASALAFSSAPSFSDVYLGGKVGKSWLNDACHITSDTDCDDDAITGGVFAGYQFVDWLGLEAGYDYLGKYTADGINDESASAFTIAPKLSVPLTDVISLYGKVGGAYVDYGSESDASFLGAVGVELNASKSTGVRIEYQRLTDVNNNFARAAVNSATMNFVYRFGASEQPMTTEEPVAEVMAAEPVQEVVAEPATKKFTAQLVDSGIFEVNSAELKSESVAMLDKLVAMMKQYPQSTVTITGHTDSTGSAAYNQTLSEKRAQAIAGLLENEGIDASRITAEGKGESSPIASNETSEGRQKNRRVEINVPEFEYEE
ncbi:OmpA family protein [Vibrio cholerae]